MSKSFLEIPSRPAIGEKFGLRFINPDEDDNTDELKDVESDVDLATLTRQIVGKDKPTRIPLSRPPPSLPVPGIVVKTSNASSKPNPKHFPQGLKIFINIAWSENVDQPTGGINSESAHVIVDLIRRGADWAIPIVFNDGEHWEADKTGKRAVVYDCCVNADVYRHAMANETLKIYLIESVLQITENKTDLVLARRISNLCFSWPRI